MDLLRGNIRTLYTRYLAAAFGSALITSIYSIVDMAMVGQYHGPSGTAALAVVAPIWNIIYSLGLLTGTGGCVLFSTIKGRGAQKPEHENAYFTAALLASVLLAVAAWCAVGFFDRELLLFFGASDDTLALAQQYVQPVKTVLPVFLFNQMLSVFLRNDNAPGLATAGVLAGGIFNIFGDYFFVFTLDMGIRGAGLATAIGAVISLLVMLSHFFKKSCTLRLIRPAHLLTKLKEITVTGFSTFFIDVAMGILTILFNRQIMKYLGTNALSVYGIIINISTLVQCCAYSVGQAAQPILSVNFGAQSWPRVRQTLHCALVAAAGFALFWTVLCEAFPNTFVRIFMTPTAQVLTIAPQIIRTYALSFLLLPFNVFSTYYFQALLQPKTAIVISVARGCVVSGVLILLLPAVFGTASIWLAMPITELLIAAYVARQMTRCTGRLGA